MRKVCKAIRSESIASSDSSYAFIRSENYSLEVNASGSEDSHGQYLYAAKYSASCKSVTQTNCQYIHMSERVTPIVHVSGITSSVSIKYENDKCRTVGCPEYNCNDPKYDLRSWETSPTYSAPSKTVTPWLARLEFKSLSPIWENKCERRNLLFELNEEKNKNEENFETKRKKFQTTALANDNKIFV